MATTIARARAAGAVSPRERRAPQPDYDQRAADFAACAQCLGLTAFELRALLDDAGIADANTDGHDDRPVIAGRDA